MSGTTAPGRPGTAAAGRRGAAGRLASLLVAVATAIVITWLALAAFFNPAWVSFAQGRADAAVWTGWAPAEVDAVTRDIVVEVWLGPGTFAQQAAGGPVFAERERVHMVDVRNLVLAFTALAAAAALLLLALGVTTRGARWLWRGISVGAAGLAIGAVAIGGAFLVTFDAAFTLFHQLFFAAGSWSFDPATDRLVQLFPYQFWTETSVAIAVVGLGITVAVWAIARRLARPPGGPVPADPTRAAAAA